MNKLSFSNGNLYSRVDPKGSGEEGKNVRTQAVMYHKCYKVSITLELTPESKLKSGERTCKVRMKEYALRTS